MASPPKVPRAALSSRRGGAPRHLLVTLPAPSDDTDEARLANQQAGLAQLRGLVDHLDRPMVAWAAAEIRRKPARLLAERRALLEAGATEVPDLTRHLRVRTNMPYGAADLLAAWGKGPTPTIAPCPDPADRDPPEGAVKELARIPGEVLWQPNLGEPPGGMAVFDTQPWPAHAGLGVRVAFLAPGYQHGHPDYRHAPITDLRPPDRNDRGLGTWTIGVLCAQPIHAGLVGVCPRAELLFVRPWTEQGAEGAIHSTADAIDVACTKLHPGDVLLLAHTGLALPAEADGATFDAIRVAVARGIHVVQSAGDAAVDLDDPEHGGLFDRSVRDSGAILATGYMRHPLPPPPQSTRIWGASGTRIDLHAPAPIYTTKPSGTHRHLVQWFQGATAAATQIAGVVALVSAAEQQRSGAPVPPLQLRALLRSTGTPARIDTDRPIGGTQPNVEALLAALARD